jgi:hypothetical protein
MYAAPRKTVGNENDSSDAWTSFAVIIFDGVSYSNLIGSEVTDI